MVPMPASTPHLRIVSSQPFAQPFAQPLAQPGAIAPLRRVRASIRRPLGQILVENSAVDPGNLAKALAMQAREQARLGDILLAHDWVSESALMVALSQQWRAEVIDPTQSRPDARLIDRLGVQVCLREGVLPWRLVGAATVVATCRPDDFARLRPVLEQAFGPVLMALASEQGLHAALLATRVSVLNLNAETLVPAAESCRTWDTGRLRRGTAIAALLFGATAWLWPAVPVLLLVLWSVLTLMVTQGLKAAALVAHFRHQRQVAKAKAKAQAVSVVVPLAMARLPVVSIMIPMLRERDIAERLLRRIGRLDYPRELLDVLLVVEEEDTMTQQALAAARLPRWMRVVVVPRGPLKTKPRALNFAMNFCRGSIIGIYDAEDAPEPAQIHKVVRRFHDCGPEVACLQGMLDYYNPRANWLARCFTVEYAGWFRLVLPGLQRIGLAIPLGGTTLFFRRAAIEKLGGWDAHNVTEDADLGVRLARRGYRAELLETVTEEEANCRAWPWVKQRSRWIKGYMMTYTVHMRDPGLLYRQLGPWKFIGVQALFLGTLSQFLLAPVIWSFWLITFGLGHPVASLLPGWVLLTIALIFASAEAINLVTGFIGASLAGKRFLWPWVPTLLVYYPLGTLAAYKAAWELITQPFYWDKTAHGHSESGVEPSDDTAADQALA